jgi:transcriptional regulator with XRE-family HTH domain
MPPSRREIAAIRADLGFNQAQFARLLGVHPITVSKWERGVLVPNAHQAALIRSFRKAVQHDEDVGQQIAGFLVGTGVALALYHLLNAAFGKRR